MPILRFDTAPFIFSFVVLSSLAVLFALFPANRKKWLCPPHSCSLYCNRSLTGRVIFKQKFSRNSLLQIVRFMVLF